MAIGLTNFDERGRDMEKTAKGLSSINEKRATGLAPPINKVSVHQGKNREVESGNLALKRNSLTTRVGGR